MFSTSYGFGELDMFLEKPKQFPFGKKGYPGMDHVWQDTDIDHFRWIFWNMI